MTPTITNFIITQLIWSVTGGFSYIPINFILLFLLLKLWDNINMIKALFMSAVLTVVPCAIFFIVLNGVFVQGLGIEYVQPVTAYESTYNHLNTSLAMVSIYACMQIPLLIILRKYFVFYLWRAFVCVFCANIMTALLIYKITFAI